MRVSRAIGEPRGSHLTASPGRADRPPQVVRPIRAVYERCLQCLPDPAPHCLRYLGHDRDSRQFPQPDFQRLSQHASAASARLFLERPIRSTDFLVRDFFGDSTADQDLLIVRRQRFQNVGHQYRLAPAVMLEHWDWTLGCQSPVNLHAGPFEQCSPSDIRASARPLP